MMFASRMFRSIFLTLVLWSGLHLANAQNILILTTGDGNSLGNGNPNEPENWYVRGIIREFAAPLNEFTCSETPQTVIDPNSGLSKTVTCNSNELVNGRTLDPDVLFAPGYDLVVVASVFSEIDSGDWVRLRSAMSTRRVRGGIFLIDTANSNNVDQLRPLLNEALDFPVPSLGNGNSYFGTNLHSLNSAATGAGDFEGVLDSFALSNGYYPFTNVPYRNALYLGNGAGPVGSGVADAVGVLIPSATSFSGNGACIFTANDLGFANPDTPQQGWGANNGKVGRAFLKSFNNPVGPCAAAIASPPVIDIAKSTATSTDDLPANGRSVPYAITVSNTSAVVANNIALTDAAPAGLEFGAWTCSVINAGSAPGSTCPSTLPSGNLSTSFNLSGGAQLRFSVTAVVKDNQQELTNVATLGLPAGALCEGNRSPCDSSVSFARQPVELSITKETTASLQSPPAKGALVPYTVTVSNPSNGLASGVILTDLASSGLQLGQWTCSVLNAGNQGSICPSSLPSGNLTTELELSAGAQLQFNVTATVIDSMMDLNNVATLILPAGSSCVPNRNPCDATVTLPSAQPPSQLGVQPVPTLDKWGLLLLSAVLGWCALIGARRSRMR